MPASTMLCIVTGKRLNRGAGLGLEIAVMYQAGGHEKALQWLQKPSPRFFYMPMTSAVSSNVNNF